MADTHSGARNPFSEELIIKSYYAAQKQTALGAFTKGIKELGRKRSKRKRVHFGTVGIREHEVLLGDCSIMGGYPLSLGWRYNARTVTVEDHQAITTTTRPSTKKECVALAVSERKARLRLMGFSVRDLEISEKRRQVIHAMEWTYGGNPKPLLFKGDQIVSKYVV